MADITLSVANIKQLSKELKDFAAELRDHIPWDIEQRIAAIAAEEVRENISGIQDVDGNYLGSDNPNASVTIRTGSDATRVVWQGQQIKYLEFGTGARGASKPYPSPAMGAAGYHPDPTKESWVYRDARGGPSGRKPHRGTTGGGRGAYRISHGLAPQAPMYLASRVMRILGLARFAAPVLRKAAKDAITLR